MARLPILLSPFSRCSLTNRTPGTGYRIKCGRLSSNAQICQIFNQQTQLVLNVIPNTNTFGEMYLGTIPALAKINCISLLREESITLKPLRCGFMSFLHCDKMTHCVSADEVPWPQESPTNFENSHSAITHTLKVSDIPQSPRSEIHEVNILQAQTNRN